QRLGDAEADDERGDSRLRREPELLLAEQRQHRPLEADHGTDERVQADQQRELWEVLSEPEPRRHAVRPRLIRRFSANCGGCGGKSLRTNLTNSLRLPYCSAGLNRRSNPIVEPGLPLKPLPHAAPPKCAG